jgi:hypothetical protein
MVFLISALAAMLVASGTNKDGAIIHWEYWFTIFQHISPYFWAALGVSIAIGMSVLGAAWCGSSSPLQKHLIFCSSVDFGRGDP